MAGQKSSSDLDTIYHGNAERAPRGSDLRHMSAPSGPPNGIGQPVRRKEDVRLLTGRGHYGDDLALPRMVHAAFVRSPHAHARIRSMDKTAALAVPGALAVLAGADYVADGLKPHSAQCGARGAARSGCAPSRHASDRTPALAVTDRKSAFRRRTTLTFSAPAQQPLDAAVRRILGHRPPLPYSLWPAALGPAA